jgi:hypothetical protein
MRRSVPVNVLLTRATEPADAIFLIFEEGIMAEDGVRTDSLVMALRSKIPTSTIQKSIWRMVALAK